MHAQLALKNDIFFPVCVLSNTLGARAVLSVCGWWQRGGERAGCGHALGSLEVLSGMVRVGSLSLPPAWVHPVAPGSWQRASDRFNSLYCISGWKEERGS